MENDFILEKDLCYYISVKQHRKKGIWYFTSYSIFYLTFNTAYITNHKREQSHKKGGYKLLHQWSAFL